MNLLVSRNFLINFHALIRQSVWEHYLFISQGKGRNGIHSKIFYSRQLGDQDDKIYLPSRKSVRLGRLLSLVPDEEEMNVSKRKKLKKALTLNAPVFSHQQDSQSTPIMPLGNSENHQQDSQSTPIMPLGNSERRKERRREIHILPDLPEEGRLNLPENTSSFEQIVLSTLKHVLKNQENIQAELALISGAAVHVDDEIEDLLPSPVNSIEDFIQWGFKLEEKQSRRKLASFLIAFGGTTCLETVRNILKKTVTNNILALYSLRGKKGKKVFQDHNLYRVLIRACFKLHKCKRQEIEDCMIEVLKHAPHMPGGPKYKKPASRRREDISDSE